MTGRIQLHHITPELWVLDARQCSHRWVVFHDTYSLCLIDPRGIRSTAQWTYRRRTYSTNAQQPVMLMQPGELHCNADRTEPGDFVVVQVDEALMRTIARELGWPSHDLDLRAEHASCSHPAMLAALQNFRRDLCETLYSGAREPGLCTCPLSLAVHLENLTEIVAVLIRSCAEPARRLVLPEPGTAAVRKAIEYLSDHHRDAYSLTRLSDAAGCSPYYLAHLFREQVGVAPSVFRNRMLVSKTCQAIVARPEAPLDLIAREVGWASTARANDDTDKATLMIRHFKRTLGLTPGRFRASLRRMSAAERRAYSAGIRSVPGRG